MVKVLIFGRFPANSYPKLPAGRDATLLDSKFAKHLTLDTDQAEVLMQLYGLGKKDQEYAFYQYGGWKTSASDRQSFNLFSLINFFSTKKFKNFIPTTCLVSITELFKHKTVRQNIEKLLSEVSFYLLTRI